MILLLTVEWKSGLKSVRTNTNPSVMSVIEVNKLDYLFNIRRQIC